MDTVIIKQIDALLKKNLKGFATKKDLKDVLKDYPAKQDLNTALRDFATKKDLKYEIDEAVADIIHAVEVGKADKDSLKELEDRVKIIENQVNITAH